MKARYRYAAPVAGPGRGGADPGDAVAVRSAVRAEPATPAGAGGRAPEIRPAAARRARDRRAQQDQRRARRGDRRRQDCRGRREDRPGGRGQERRPGGSLRHARSDRHPRAHLHRHRRAPLVRRRQQRLSRRLHAARRRHHGGGRRAAPAGATSRTSSSASSIAPRPASSPSSTSSATACAAAPTSRTSRTWRRRRPPRWRRSIPGLIVGIKTAHFAGPEWAPVERAVEAGTIANVPVMVDFGANRPERPLSELVTKKLRPGRHLHARLLRAARRAGSVRSRQPGAARRPQARRDLRRRPRRRQLPVAHRGAGDEGRLRAGLDLDRPPHRQHEQPA